MPYDREDIYKALREVTWTAPSRPLNDDRQFLFTETPTHRINELIFKHGDVNNRYIFDEFQGCRVYLSTLPNVPAVIVLESLTREPVKLSVLGNFIELNELPVDVSCMAVSTQERKDEIDDEVRFLKRFGTVL